MFKYIWLFEGIPIYMLWTYLSIKDIIKNYRKDTDNFDLMDCRGYAIAWASMTIIIYGSILIASFVCWCD